MVVVGGARKKVFTPEFLKENFEQEHSIYTKEEVEKTSGYPDMGCGRYAQKLSYADWL
jgi:glutathione S-transferase